MGRVVRPGAAVVGLTAVVALLGWWGGVRVLASAGTGWIPMAPSTAVLFLCCAAAVALAERGSSSRAARLTTVALGLTTAAVALVLLVLGVRGIHPGVEHPGIAIAHIRGLPPAGHMSPITACCFLLAAATLLCMPPDAGSRTRRGVAAGWLAGVLVATSLVLIVAYVCGAPLFYEGTFIPPAATTSFAFLVLGIAQFGVVCPRVGWRDDVPDERRRAAGVLVLVFGLLATGIVVAGWFYYRHSVREFQAAAGRNLTAIAATKVDDLVQWRAERLGDGAVFHGNANFVGLVKRVVDAPEDADARERLRVWLAKVQGAYRYDRLCFHDAAGGERLAVPDSPERHAASLPPELAETLRTGQIRLTDLHRNEQDRRVYMRILVPILAEDDRGRPLGVLVLRIDPRQYLYPLVQRWPVPSRTAETLLVRREGDEVVFLNDLRFREDAALSLRLPAADAALPAALAVAGREGVVEGVDYRGAPVLACVRRVPDSPWFLVARMDRAEVFGPLRRGLWTMVGLVACLVLAAGAIMAHLWHWQTARFLNERYEAAETRRRQEERYHRTLDTMMEGCQILDRDWRYLYVNDAAAAHGRRSRAELVGRRLPDCYPGIEATEMYAGMRRCMEEHTAQRLENEFHYANGDRAWFELSIEPVPEGVFVLSVDITERRRRQQEQEVAIQFLRLAGDSEDRRALIEKAVGFFREHWGFEAIGVRLREGDDFPYYQTTGFSDEFVLLENSLCAPRADGPVVLDDQGRPMLDCMCGNVIQGRTDPAQPFFTPGGSFWSNCTTELLATTTEADRQARTRNCCNGAGYESVALVPLRSGDTCLGLLQLNDRRQGMFTPELVALFERLAAHLAVSLAKLRAEEKLRHLNEVLLAVRNVNQLIVHERDRDALLARACDVLTETRGYQSAWLALRDETGRLQALAESAVGAGLAEVRAQLERGEWPACCRAAFAQPGVVVMHDARANCAKCPLAHSYRGTAALAAALRHGDRVYGVLVVALPAELADDEQEQILFRELVEDIGFALHGMAAEDAREQAEQRYRTLFEASADGILIAAMESRQFRYANPAVCRFLGYSAAELVTMGVADVHPPEALPQVIVEFEAQTRGAATVAADLPCLRKDGQVVYADISAAPMVVDGEACVAGFFRDVTARRQAAAEREELESQLAQAQKIESVGRLAGGVAHDFNNMLTVILGQAQMLARKLAADDPRRGQLAEIEQAARRSADLTRQLLAFARRQTIAPVALDLNDAVGDLLKMLGRLIGEDIDLVWRPATDLWWVEIDPSQLDQILANLCVNARDAIGGVGKVTIETRNVSLDAEYCASHVEARPGEFVVLAVSDDGCGMDRETCALIFEPFFTTKPTGQGTGLGLSTVYGIVKQNNGFVNVYSEPGKGTTFRIYLPRLAAAGDAVVEPTVSQPGRGDETVLVVEDDSSVRLMVRLFLEDFGYRVLEAALPADALALAAADPGGIDLLITDVVMPEMSGRDLAGALVAQHPGLKVLYMSGYTANAIAHHGVLDKGIHFLGKPFVRDDLARKVREVLDG